MENKILYYPHFFAIKSSRFKLHPCEIVTLELANGSDVEDNCFCYYWKGSLELQVELLFLVALNFSYLVASFVLLIRNCGCLSSTVVKACGGVNLTSRSWPRISETRRQLEINKLWGPSNFTLSVSSSLYSKPFCLKSWFTFSVLNTYIQWVFKLIDYLSRV